MKHTLHSVAVILKTWDSYTYPCMGRLCVSICDVTSCMFIGRPWKTNDNWANE